MDRLYKNVKTGEKKHLPAKVYEAVKKIWVPIEEEIEPQSYISSEKATEDLLKKFEKPILPVKDELTDTPNYLAIYESLSGKPADKRWSEKKLIQKIEELKETNK